MSKAEILEELPKLAPEDLAEIQARIEELAGDGWVDDDELTPADKATLDTALAEYQKHPDAGSTWQEVEARLRAKLRR